MVLVNLHISFQMWLSKWKAHVVAALYLIGVK